MNRDKTVLLTLTVGQLSALADLCLIHDQHRPLRDSLLATINNHDGSSDSNRVVDLAIDEGIVGIEDEGVGLSLHFPGFGTNDAEPGYGPPVYVEYRAGVPHVLVWADVNQEEPTHSISLAGAAESKREE